jgi:hypothetical protein
MTFLVDSNVLLRPVQLTHPNIGTRRFIATQNAAEFWNVLT